MPHIHAYGHAAASRWDRAASLQHDVDIKRLWKRLSATPQMEGQYATGTGSTGTVGGTPSTGPVIYIGRTTSPINKGFSGSINRHDESTRTSTGVTDTAVFNLFANVAANRWVAYAVWPSGARYLIAAEC